MNKHKVLGIIFLLALGVSLSLLTPKDQNTQANPKSEEIKKDPENQTVYRQETIGFEVKLPAEWKVSADIGQAVSFGSRVDQSLGLSVAVVDNTVDEVRQRITANNETVSQQPTLFAGKAGVVIIGKNVMGTTNKQILIPWKDNQTLLIAGPDVEAVNNILSSFKFIK